MEYQGVGCYYLGSCSLIEARGKGRMFGLVPAKLFLKKETGVQPFAVWREAFFGRRFGGVLEAPCSCKQSAITRLLLSPSILKLSASALRSWIASH